MPEHIKKKLLEEIKQLEHELAHELPLEIKKAAALGDLSENAEYHMAKQRRCSSTRAWVSSRSEWESSPWSISQIFLMTGWLSAQPSSFTTHPRMRKSSISLSPVRSR